MATKKPYKLDRVAIRMVKERPLLSDELVNSPDLVVKLMQELLKDYDREVYAIVNFQSNLQPINMNIVSVGALNASLVHPREMLKSVVLSNAASVMLIHNHPGGVMRPSNEDKDITVRVAEVMKLMEVNLLDHIIVGPDKQYYSFYEHSEPSLSGEAPNKKRSRDLER